MLVTFDELYRVRDLYFPHVGQENHAGGGPCRFGVWADLPAPSTDDRRRNRLYWTDQGWRIERKYQPDTLATDVTLAHDGLQLKLRCCDVVDFHRPVLVRRIEIANLVDKSREVRLFHHHDVQMFGTRLGDTAYYDPQLRSLIHYRKSRYLMACFYVNGEPQIDDYATGTAGFQGAEGTWRDAEDGRLGNNAIAQGSVDSTMMCRAHLPANGKTVVYLVLACGSQIGDLEELHAFLHRESPQGVIDRTTAYWRLWLSAAWSDITDEHPDAIPPKVLDLFKRSLLLVRTQIDNDGAIIAANDSDYMQFSRDTYSYLWPRDGALVADAMDAAGFPDLARSFFTFCNRIVSEGGYFLHKYNPDGSPASSWHPWVDGNGQPQLPIQEDETALVVWAVWRHFSRYRDIEFVRPLWMRMIRPAADFMVRFRDPDTHLPLPSYDLWEERFGVHAFTVATVYGGLRAAYRFAVSFGDTRRAARYKQAADEVKAAFCRRMWSDRLGRFVRRITPVDAKRTAMLVDEVRQGRAPRPEGSDGFEELSDHNGNGSSRKRKARRAAAADVEYEVDPVIDASMYAIFAMGLLPVEDERVARTMAAIREELWIKTDVGGVARYTDDYYHQVTQDTDRVPGNPWFICTLWLAEYEIARATTLEGLEEAMRVLEWTADHALASGVLAEQVHPETNAPLSVSPLTWSHATVVSTVVKYMNKFEDLTEGGPPHDKPRRRRATDPVPLTGGD